MKTCFIGSRKNTGTSLPIRPFSCRRRRQPGSVWTGGVTTRKRNPVTRTGQTQPCKNVRPADTGTSSSEDGMGHTRSQCLPLFLVLSPHVVLSALLASLCVVCGHDSTSNHSSTSPSRKMSLGAPEDTPGPCRRREGTVGEGVLRRHRVSVPVLFTPLTWRKRGLHFLRNPSCPATTPSVPGPETTHH